MANKKEDEEVIKVATEQPKIDIKKYLGMKPVADSIGKMFIVLYKGQMKTESEWDSAVKEVLSRKA